MSSCLYECLCEAGLERYYTHFTAMGYLRTQELAKLSMNDYSILGVNSMHDRKRLFHLIQIIKAVQEEEHDCSASSGQAQTSSLNLWVEREKTGPRPHLDFVSLSNKGDQLNQDLESDRSAQLLCVNRHQDTGCTLLDSTSPVDQLHTRHFVKEVQRFPEGEDCCSMMFMPNNNSRDSEDIEMPNLHKIIHVSGYNYGLPHSVLRYPGKDQVWTDTEKIRVCVRKRPLGAQEERRGEVDIAMVEERKSVLIHERKEAVDLTQYIQQHVFYFDEVFEETCTNYDVYLKTTYPLIQHVFNGGKATCFAYGQTGAGKTHTMIGTSQNPGLYALAAKDLFKELKTSKPGSRLFIWISFYEMYCGQLYDLLNGRKRLFAREDGNHVVQIVELREIKVDGVESLLEVISRGSKGRSTGASGVNTDSSRSHAVIQVQLKDPGDFVVGRISFVDLAGSERAADARDSDKQTKIEGAEINQSLLALKECIRALDQEHAHTPFRQSKLTLVLKDSFIGNSKTCMIANISPSHVATEHTLNTLRYADRVKELKRAVRTSSTNYTGIVRSPSPKRTKETPSKSWGEKTALQKVKLGFPPSHCVAQSAKKPKSTPSVFHPSNVPLSSTPKGADKNHVSQEIPKEIWLGHTTPIKGMFKTGCFGVKKNGGRSNDKISVIKSLLHDFQTEASHIGGRMKYEHKKSQVQEKQSKNQKIQAVYPIQKEIVSRSRICFTDQTNKSDSICKESAAQCLENGLHLHGNRSESIVDMQLLQKERERHLYLYHQQLQQLQQPLLLQQKLPYQPLKELYLQYNQPKIGMYKENVGHVSSTPSEVQRSYDQGEGNNSRDWFPDCQSQTVQVAKGEVRERKNSRELLFYKDDNQREEDSKGNSSECRTEDCIASHSSGDNTIPEKLNAEENTVSGQERLGNFSTDPENITRDKNTELCSSGHQAAYDGVSQHLRNHCTENKVLLQTQESTDSHFNLQSSIKRQKGAQPLLTVINNTISSIDCIPEDSVNVSSDISMRPLSKLSFDGIERMMVSDDQFISEMVLAGGLLEKDEASTQFCLRNWAITSQDYLLEDPKTSSDKFHHKERSNCFQNLLLNGELKRETSSLHDGSSQYSSINCAETPCKDLKNSTVNSPSKTGNRGASLQHPPAQAFSYKESLVVLSCGSQLSEDTSEQTECNHCNQDTKCFVSGLYDADTEETEITLELPYDIVSSPGEVESPTSPCLNWLKMQDIPSTPTRADSRRKEKIKNVDFQRLQESIDTAGKSNVLLPIESEELHKESKANGFQPQCESNSKELLGTCKENLLWNTVPFSLVCAEKDSSLFNKCSAMPNKSREGTSQNVVCHQMDGDQLKHQSELFTNQMEALGEQQKHIVQAHCEQLEEMLALFEKEEDLLKKLNISDFKDYVAQLEQIMILKTKCIRNMQGQIHCYQMSPMAAYDG
eukprot:gi/632958950/ref/XP_007895340.1/ PREDICTED: kinesin-like protein KIF24 [Callorhinchus milii]